MANDASKPALLIVDDDALLVRALSRALRCDFSIEDASTAADALEKISAGEFRFVLIDVHLGTTNGFVLFQRIQRQHPTLATRAVFMSGGLSSGEKEQVRACGCPLLLKPFDVDELQEVLLCIDKGRNSESSGVPK